MRVKNRVRDLGVTPSEDSRKYRKLYYELVEKPEGKRDSILCQCGQTYIINHAKRHFRTNKRHKLFVANKDNPDFVREYFEIVNNPKLQGFEKRALKCYYFQVLRKKYGFGDSNSNSSNSNSETESDD